MSNPVPEFKQAAAAASVATPEECTAFFKAVYDGKFEPIKETIKKYPDAVHWADTDRITAMHFVGAQNDPSIIRFLVDHGANINARDRVGWTPLMWFITFEPQPEMIRLMVAYGAKLDIKDDGGRTALQVMRAGSSGSTTYAESIAILERAEAAETEWKAAEKKERRAVAMEVFTKGLSHGFRTTKLRLKKPLQQKL